MAITSGSFGKLINGKLEVAVKKGVRQSLDVELSEGFEGALKVVAHEI